MTRHTLLLLLTLFSLCLLPCSAQQSPSAAPQWEYRSEPVYPTTAREKGIRGRVTVEFSLNKDGMVKSVHSLNGDPLLAKAAVECVKTWKAVPPQHGQSRGPFAVSFRFGTPPAPVPVPVTKLDEKQSFPLLIYHENPNYPKLARDARHSGDVVLRAIIAADGSVASLTPVSGSDEFIQPSMDAVYKWRYKPLEVDGKPVPWETDITVHFTLSGG